MDAATLVTIITMFVVTNTDSEFIKYDGLMDCLKDKRVIEKKRDGRKVICGPSLAQLDEDGQIIAIFNKMPDQSGSLKLGGTAKSLTEKKKKKQTEVLTQD